MTTDTRSKYAVDGKCFYCGRDSRAMYCNSKCQDGAAKEGGDCVVCGLLTRKDVFYCSQECENNFDY